MAKQFPMHDRAVGAGSRRRRALRSPARRWASATSSSPTWAAPRLTSRRSKTAQVSYREESELVRQLVYVRKVDVESIGAGGGSSRGSTDDQPAAGRAAERGCDAGTDLLRARRHRGHGYRRRSRARHLEPRSRRWPTGSCWIWRRARAWRGKAWRTAGPRRVAMRRGHRRDHRHPHGRPHPPGDGAARSRPSFVRAVGLRRSQRRARRAVRPWHRCSRKWCSRSTTPLRCGRPTGWPRCRRPAHSRRMCSCALHSISDRLVGDARSSSRLRLWEYAHAHDMG